MMGKLDGKVALISGGARGQGEAEAKAFVTEGAKVVFGDVRDDEGKQVEAAIHQAGGDAVYVHLDVTQEDDWQRAVREAMTRYGRLDILVNNAGIIIPRVPIEERTEADWDRVMSVNAKGVFLGTKHAIPAMRQAGEIPPPIALEQVQEKVDQLHEEYPGQTSGVWHPHPIVYGNLFASTYFLMTGLHALHVIVGMISGAIRASTARENSTTERSSVLRAASPA